MTSVLSGPMKDNQGQAAAQLTARAGTFFSRRNRNSAGERKGDGTPNLLALPARRRGIRAGA